MPQLEEFRTVALQPPLLQRSHAETQSLGGVAFGQEPCHGLAHRKERADRRRALARARGPGGAQLVALGGDTAAKLRSWRTTLRAVSNCFRCASGAAKREAAIA
jgi:hypothetical protein